MDPARRANGEISATRRDRERTSTDGALVVLAAPSFVALDPEHAQAAVVALAELLAEPWVR